MTLPRLRVFLAIARARSYRRAVQKPVTLALMGWIWKWPRQDGQNSPTVPSSVSTGVKSAETSADTHYRRSAKIVRVPLRPLSS
jgi:hypothetical protein